MFSGRTNRFQRVVFVDPGITATGWAFFAVINTDGSQPLPPERRGVFRPARTLSWQDKAQEVWEWFAGVCREVRAKTVVIEFPVMWTGNVTSQTSAERGDLFKLAYLVGGLAHLAKEKGATPILMTPQRWKGQLPKTVIINRIIARWPHLGRIRDHEGDAIGMGLAAQDGL